MHVTDTPLVQYGLIFGLGVLFLWQGVLALGAAIIMLGLMAVVWDVAERWCRARR